MTLGTAAGAQPVITGINTFAGANGQSLIGLSADGSAATGQAFLANGTTSAFLWTRSGGNQNIGTLPGGTNGMGTGLSADGSIVCGAEFAGGARAFRWTSATGPVNIGSIPGGSGSQYANGISGDGSIIVGLGSSADGPRAFRRVEGSTMQSLGALAGGSVSEAIAISTDGSAIAGVSGSSGGDRAFRWTSAGAMQNLGVMSGGTSSIAFGISGDGLVVTGSGDTAAGTRAFRWSEPTGMVSLDVVDGYDFSEGYGASIDGASIVGGCGGNSGGVAFLWTASTGIVDLNVYLPSIGLDLTGWTLDLAKGISGDGRVIAGDGTFNGEARSFVISNIPGPGALSVVCVGALMGVRRRRPLSRVRSAAVVGGVFAAIGGTALTAHADVQVAGYVRETYTNPVQVTELGSYSASFPGTIQRGALVDQTGINPGDLSLHCGAISGGGPGYVTASSFVEHIRHVTTGAVGSYALQAVASADATWTDMVVTGPAGGPSMVPFSVNIALDGNAGLNASTVSDPAGVGYGMDASVGFVMWVNDAVAVNGSHWYVNSDNGGPAYYPPADGIFSNFNGSVHTTSGIVMVPVNTPFSIHMQLQTLAHLSVPAGRAGILASTIDFGHTASFDTTAPTPFVVPAGYTVNSVSASVVNNTYSVPTPGAGAILLGGMTMAARRRRR